MDLPRTLLALQHNVDAADISYNRHTGDNAKIALAVWSDASAALAQAISVYAAENRVSRQEVEQALQRATRQAG